jgi:Ca2+-transporting ATPase
LLATNLSEIETMLASITLGLGQPLNPMQLLWINLITDIFPGLALAVEGAETDVMQRPPRSADQEVVGRKDLLRYSRESGIITAGAMASYLYGRLRYGPGATANSHTFHTLVLAQLFHAISCRSDVHSIFSKGYLPPNKSLSWAIGISVTTQAIVMLSPSLRRLLGITPISLLDTLVVILNAGGPMLVNEFFKPASTKELIERVSHKNRQEGTKDET